MFIHLMLIVVALSALSGCMGGGPKPTAELEDFMAKEKEAQQQIKAINDKLFASASPTPQPQDYILGEGDRLNVSIFEAPELKSSSRIGARGMISLPLIGVINIKGLTVREAEQAIEDRFREQYIKDPHVTVFVEEYVSGKITVLGSVKKPGTYNNLTRQKVLDVLALAEGLNEKAGRVVQVRRAGEDANQPTVYLIDIDDIILKGRTDVNIEVKSGDSLYVPEAGTVYVDGAVKKPGNYQITPNMTVREAIAAAGGFTSVAMQSNIKVVRPDEEGKKEVVQTSGKDIETEENKIKLRDRDVVFVETNALERFVYGLRLNFLGYGIAFAPPTQ